MATVPQPLASGVIAVFLPIAIVIFAIVALATRLGPPTSPASPRVLLTIRIIAIFLAIVVVIDAIEAHPTGLLPSHMATPAIDLAVGIIAVRFTIVIVIDAIETLSAALLVDLIRLVIGATIGLAHPKTHPHRAHINLAIFDRACVTAIIPRGAGLRNRDVLLAIGCHTFIVEDLPLWS
jgi:hypothetical protein